MQRLMEDYDYVSKALTKNRGLDFRIRLIELWFNDVTRHNATYPQKRPLTYEEMKSKLVKLLSLNSESISLKRIFFRIETNFRLVIVILAVILFFVLSLLAIRRITGLRKSAALKLV